MYKDQHDISLDADLISSSGLTAMAVTELSLATLHLVVSASSLILRVLMLMVVLSWPREN